MSTTAPKIQPARTAAIHRVEVRTRPGLLDPRGQAAAASARELGFAVRAGSSARVYLLEGALTTDELRRVIHELLCDPVTEVALEGARALSTGESSVEVHPLPGVMDPAAQSVRGAIADLIGVRVEVSTGVRYDFAGIGEHEAREIALRSLANPVVHQIIAGAWRPASLPKGTPYTLELRRVRLRGLSDDELAKLSRGAHLFLSLREMHAVRDEYERLGRDPTDIELETIAQTWSEHCVHKTLKAKVRYRSGAVPTAAARAVERSDRPGQVLNPDGSITINNLLKSTIAAATRELISEGCDWTLSVFKDNSGVVAFDESWGVNIKVETHNRPSAIEPYGGAATGIGGCIRDVIATGLGAKPIASTDVFCVASPTLALDTLPPGTLHPRRILRDVVAGVRDYGNRMGIPTVSGGVHVDDRYVGNPLVFCGCVGLIPRALVKGEAREGDRIIVLGGRTGRDGVHGATFSSAELEHTASSEFAHAVQIGNAIEEKRLLDAILRARDAGPLFHALTDCGAGGFSSAIGEMGGELGAHVHLDHAPLKYAGLSYTEVWISEAQERIVLSVPPENLPALRRICDEEGVELADLGHFGTPNREIVLDWQGVEVGRLSCGFLQEGLPMPTREAVWLTREEQAERTHGGQTGTERAVRPDSVASAVHALLAHPTIASKHWIIRQYDHEVQGNTIIKPLIGARAIGPSDASVIEPIPGSGRGIALSQGLQTALGDATRGGDPYQMALAAIDECVRNLVCVGADPDRIAILDNFCWPSCDEPRNMGALVRACWGCYDGAKAYRTPFVSGKDSLSNQLRYTDPRTGEQKLIEIPYTLLVTGLGVVHDLSRCVTMDAKHAGNIILLVGATQPTLACSLYADTHATEHTGMMPIVDLIKGPATARAVAGLIARGLVRSAHDCSEGGVLVALAEMLIAGHSPQRPLGAAVHTDMPARTGTSLEVLSFAESPSRYLLEVSAQDEQIVREALSSLGVPVVPLATLNDSGVLSWHECSLSEHVDALTRSWRGTLDW